MNDAIKQILEDINNKECYYIGTNGCLYQDLTKEELLLIKDYITNLQHRINKAIDYIIDYNLTNSIVLKRSYKDLLNILKGDTNE